MREIMQFKLHFFLVIAFASLVAIAAIVLLFSAPAACNACYGGPCTTSAACVSGCHCIAGRCS